MSPVGVVVITQNRRDRVLDTLSRLLALPERPPVVLVDNASTDGTVEAVTARYDDVRVVALPTNRGAAARNLGAEILETPYVAFSDDDSWWAPGALGTAAELFDRHPRLGLLAASTLVGPEETPDPLNEVLATSPLGTDADLPGPSVLGFLACASVVRKSALKEAGGFSPVLHFGAEETLLALDLSTAGWGVVYCPQVVAHHHPDRGPRPGRSVRIDRNALLTTWMRRPWPRIAGATGRLAQAAATDSRARSALAEAFAHLPKALQHRARLPIRVENDLRLLEKPPSEPFSTSEHPSGQATSAVTG
jgi:GT2 family glycosyltransferase